MAEWRLGLAPLRDWAELAWPELDLSARAERLQSIQRRIDAGALSERFWLGLFECDVLVAATHLDPMGGRDVQVCAVVGDRLAAERSQGLDMLFGLVARLLDALECTGQHRAELAVARPRYEAALARAGFERTGERVEFRAQLDALPGEVAAGRLRWTSMTAPSEAAETLTRVAVGDPHTDEDEDALAAIESWLDDPVLTSGPDCVHLGWLPGGTQPAALVVAQINPATGWSRLSYLGVAPEARGSGLGAEVHRHGLAMLRAQGGALYHGGTARENASMLGLFERLGCAPFRELVDWRRGRS